MTSFTTNPPHPSPDTITALRTRDPGALLLFGLGGDTFAAYDGDASEVNRLIGTAPGTMFYADTASDERWVTFTREHLERVLASVVAQGGRAMACELVPAAPRGVPVERVVTTGEVR